MAYIIVEDKTKFNFDIVKALHKIRPKCPWTLTGDYYEGINWPAENTQPKPTVEEISSACDELLAEWESLEYSRNRFRAYINAKVEYGDLIIALWEKIIEGNDIPASEIQAIRERIKGENPKP